MLTAFVSTLVAIIIGDFATQALGLPVPGSVLALLAVAAIFAGRGEIPPAMGRLFDAIIPIAPMLFVPAAVGVLANWDLIAADWLPIAAVITLGTAAALLATGLAMQGVLALLGRRELAPWPK